MTLQIDIGSPVMELNDFGDIGEQFLQTGIVVGPSGDWDCGPKVRLCKINFLEVYRSKIKIRERIKITCRIKIMKIS